MPDTAVSRYLYERSHFRSGYEAAQRRAAAEMAQLRADLEAAQVRIERLEKVAAAAKAVAEGPHPYSVPVGWTYKMTTLQGALDDDAAATKQV